MEGEGDSSAHSQLMVTLTRAGSRMGEKLEQLEIKVDLPTGKDDKEEEGRGH